jgi:transposase
MKKHDGRKLSHKKLESIRIKSVEKVLNGESAVKVIEETGLSQPRIYEWLAGYNENGFEALRAKTIPGRPSKLSTDQLAQLYKILVEKNATDEGFPNQLWTRSYIQKLIEKKFEVEISTKQIGRKLQELGLRPDISTHPSLGEQSTFFLHRAQAAKITYTKKEITTLARTNNALIYFGDDSRMDSPSLSNITYIPNVRASRLLFATTTRGHWKFLARVVPSYSGKKGKDAYQNFYSVLFKEFVKNLSAESERPTFLIMQNKPLYISQNMTQIIVTKVRNLKLFTYVP